MNKLSDNHMTLICQTWQLVCVDGTKSAFRIMYLAQRLDAHECRRWNAILIKSKCQHVWSIDVHRSYTRTERADGRLPHTKQLFMIFFHWTQGIITQTIKMIIMHELYRVPFVCYLGQKSRRQIKNEYSVLLRRLLSIWCVLCVFWTWSTLLFKTFSHFSHRRIWLIKYVASPALQKKEKKKKKSINYFSRCHSMPFLHDMRLSSLSCP